MEKKKISIEKLYYAGLAIVVMAVFILIGYAGGIFNKNTLEPLEDFNQGWTITFADRMTDNDGVKGYHNIFEKKLDKDIEQSKYIGFVSYHQFVKVYANDELIYSFGYDITKSIMKSPGNVYNIVPVSGYKAGTDIRIELVSVYDKYGKFEPDIMMGRKSDFYYKSINRSMIAIIICLILLFTGIVFVGVWLVLSRRFGLNYALMYLGTFSILIAIWSIHETDLMYIIPTNKQIATYISFVTFTCLVTPVVLFIRETYGQDEAKTLNRVCFVNTVISGIIFVLQFFKIFDFVEMVTVIHIMVVGGLYFLFKISIREVYRTFKKRYLNLFSVLVIMLLLAIAIDLIRYTLYYSYDSALFTRAALMIYIIGAGMLNINETIHVIEVGFNAGKYEKMAYIDALTGAYTRAAFDEQAELLDRKMSNYNKIAIVNFDINCLKKLNDNYGHDVGDEYIKKAAEIIMDAFADCGKCYRVGGDEFIVIFERFRETVYYNAEHRMQKLIDDFNANRRQDRPELGISHGYATGNRNDDTMEKVMKMADSNMYVNKKEIKNN